MSTEADLAKLAEPASHLEQHADRRVVIDEMHRAENLFLALPGFDRPGRRRGLRAGRFLLLG